MTTRVLFVPHIGTEPPTATDLAQATDLTPMIEEVATTPPPTPPGRGAESSKRT